MQVGELSEIFQWRKDEGCQPGLPGWKAEDRVHLGEEMSDVLVNEIIKKYLRACFCIMKLVFGMFWKVHVNVCMCCVCISVYI